MVEEISITPVLKAVQGKVPGHLVSHEQIDGGIYEKCLHKIVCECGYFIKSDYMPALQIMSVHIKYALSNDALRSGRVD